MLMAGTMGGRDGGTRYAIKHGSPATHNGPGAMVEIVALLGRLLSEHLCKFAQLVETSGHIGNICKYRTNTI